MPKPSEQLLTMPMFTRLKIHEIIHPLGGVSRLESGAIKVSQAHGVDGVVVHLKLHIISKIVLEICYVRELAASHNRGRTECARYTITSRQSIYHVNTEINPSSDHNPRNTMKRETIP